MGLNLEEYSVPLGEFFLHLTQAEEFNSEQTVSENSRFLQGWRESEANCSQGPLGEALRERRGWGWSSLRLIEISPSCSLLVAAGPHPLLVFKLSASQSQALGPSNCWWHVSGILSRLAFLPQCKKNKWKLYPNKHDRKNNNTCIGLIPDLGSCGFSVPSHFSFLSRSWEGRDSRCDHFQRSSSATQKGEKANVRKAF